MKLSVALCTYNGEKYLADQLASVRAQSRLPDEVVVCDDVSTDGTVGVVRRFAAEVSFPVRVEVNAENLRSTRNFAKAIGLCTGDVVVLSDQDDVWLPHKLETLERTLLAHPEAGFVWSNAAVVNDTLNPLGFTLWDAIRFSPSDQRRVRQGRAFEVLLKRYRVTGATMAFRAAYRDIVLPIPPEWVHDAWIALVIAAVAPCVPIEEPLIRYRQHASQQIGQRMRGLYAQYLLAKQMTRGTFEAVAGRYAMARDRLGGVRGVSARDLELLDRKAQFFTRRAAMRDARWRFPRILREVWEGGYSRYALGWKSVAQDLIL
ncbi:glycosyltransferase family 2 protein [Fimbriiglobus ruber]|uniref:Alpha-L-Rha alpha-1,3-L-rhamnosyltransferase n=1 Tax=Fimbriiglobus ruber TaxID=1908690 RepID=A0A225DRM5_9BACT|nr:glycosyltransferase family 2 protein [Fimbriiglobus ruber]OWK43961.1 Alpha-L-Rha alpha-1,3-L-rhamnosyltransferase [Fimbriiglobus ruber]